LIRYESTSELNRLIKEKIKNMESSKQENNLKLLNIDK